MEIRVSGHQIETGEALQAHVSDRMNAIADKYFSRAIGAHATFGKGPHDSFQCDIVAHVMQGLVLKGHGQAQDAHVAFEGAADRILFDAPAAALPGGTGTRFDWSLLKGHRHTIDWGVAGGLTPANVAQAIAETGAPLVDVSSGVESAPGVKDMDKIAAFLKAVGRC